MKSTIVVMVAIFGLFSAVLLAPQTANAQQESSDKPVTIHATKIVCENEADLPNWGDKKNDSGKKPFIGNNTAKKWIETHEGCEIVPSWEFQWEYSNDLGNWHTFKKKTEIKDLNETNQIRLREVEKEGYIPFAGVTKGDENGEAVSAEFYCQNDILYYDNYDFVNLKKSKSNYYCVGWNVLDYGSITGRKYYDVNQNGTFDKEEKTEAGDPNRLNDWKISLFYSDWKSVGQDVHYTGETGLKGQYRFENLEPGSYYVCEENRTDEGWIQSEPNEGPQTENGLYCHKVKVKPGQDVTGIQFGNYQAATLKGKKCEDPNGNGDFLEAHGAEVDCIPLEGWEINLYNNLDKESEPIATTSTDENGMYYFTNELKPGTTYYVKEEMQDGWMQTRPSIPFKRDYHIVKGNKIEAGATYWRNFGNTRLYNLEGYKWNDRNMDGEMNRFENRMDGWTIFIDSNGNGEFNEGEQNDVTDDDGYYYFEDLPAGEYSVCEVQQPGWIQSYPENQGCYDITLPTEGDHDEYAFGNYQIFNIEGYKWHDANGNGHRDCTETKESEGLLTIPSKDFDEWEPDNCESYSEETLSGWTIFIDENYNEKLDEGEQSTVTDENGNYTFNNLPTGEYIVCEVQQPGWEQTYPQDYTTKSNCHTVNVSEKHDGPSQQGEDSRDELEYKYNFGNRTDADLVLTKEVDLTTANIGDTLTYTLTVINNGDTPYPNSLQVEDVLPAEVTLIEASIVDSGIFDGTSTITWPEFELAGNTPWTTTFQVTVNELTATTNIDNVANLYQLDHGITGDIGIIEDTRDPGHLPPIEKPISLLNKVLGIHTANATSEITEITEITEPVKTLIATANATTLVTIPDGPFLTIVKDVDATEAGPGDTLNYSVVVTNVGDQNATNVVVDDLLPAGLIYQDGTTTKQWLFDVILPGQSKTINYVAIIEDDAVSSDYTNIASVGATGLETVKDEATTVVAKAVLIPIVLGDEALPALSVNKTANVEFANLGDTITYTIVVTNTGDAMAVETVLIDHIAAGMQFTDTVASTHTWMLGDIAPGNSVTTTYDVVILKDNEPGIYRNTAEVWAQGVANVFDTADVEVRKIQVLGAETLPTTGGSLMPFIYLLGAGLVITFSGFLLKLTFNKK